MLVEASTTPSPTPYTARPATKTQAAGAVVLVSWIAFAYVVWEKIPARVPVHFGATSVQLIEIKSGLQPGDKVIISDMSQYDGVAAIVLR